MNYFQIATLALIQGLAELLPISSSAHVIVAERLMGLDPSSPDLTFLLVMLHTGTMFAVLFYFWPRWRLYLFASRAPGERYETAPSRFHFLKMVVLASAFTGVLGLGLKILLEQLVLVQTPGHDKAEVEQLFKNLPLMASSLFLVGVLIIAAGLRRTGDEMKVIPPASAMWIGIVQALCLPFRGFSRSGATISVALFRDVARPLAEEFSFALAVVLTPPVIVLELRRLLHAQNWHGREELVHLLLPGLVGMVFSFLAGLAALRLLSAVLERGRWKYFGYYCIAASLGVLAVWYRGF
jgi:undecaprenyl-diphosphatase